MTSQPPQTWDTLPDDPADIPFPIVVGWKALGSGQVNWTAMADGPETLGIWIRYHGDPDWWMPWPTFQPDPMTVDAWHPMKLLPDGHPEAVWIENWNGTRVKVRRTCREHDAVLGRLRWCSEAAQMATTDANTAAAEAARGEG